MDLEKVERFFKGACTPEEVDEVLDWFGKPEGQAFLEKKLNHDIDLLKDDHIKPLMSEVRSDEMWSSIEKDVDLFEKKSHTYSSKRAYSTYWKVAAAVLVMFISALFIAENWAISPEPKQAETQPILYKAESDQQKMLSLSDGTQIRLNSNAEVMISEDYGRENREVTLKGEAYFEVIHNEEKPFVIHTPGASIKDLGTAFNVRALPGKENVQVAVTEGKVSMWSDQQTEQEATELTPGQFGYIDLEKRTIQVDEFSINNYLSWMNGRLKFNEAPLHKVSEQLNRIFDLSFSYSDEALKKLPLSADFQYDSPDKVLEVISMVLHINYQMDGKKVVWSREKNNSGNTL
ncbi:FecR domain-containing protein [Aliifodinibius sp. S!AR15-10]|uniref:FecR family protein n=1 Tax=Aliifodinibius sp. S!AR15-10 TaxID=2950437 RepID=UPI0028593F62|nr:FecR domain-containing protein [Aliifodinibius sp. S!AR15-10]MDR8392699.1 FecR domain-containing protein [Aliifodinibius sp. S!AR15-10]